MISPPSPRPLGPGPLPSRPSPAVWALRSEAPAAAAHGLPPRAAGGSQRGSGAPPAACPAPASRGTGANTPHRRLPLPPPTCSRSRPLRAWTSAHFRALNTNAGPAARTGRRRSRRGPWQHPGLSSQDTTARSRAPGGDRSRETWCWSYRRRSPRTTSGSRGGQCACATASGWGAPGSPKGKMPSRGDVGTWVEGQRGF